MDVLVVDLDAPLEEQPRHLDVSAGDRRMQRSHPGRGLRIDQHGVLVFERLHLGYLTFAYSRPQVLGLDVAGGEQKQRGKEQFHVGLSSEPHGKAGSFDPGTIAARPV